MRILLVSNENYLNAKQFLLLFMPDSSCKETKFPTHDCQPVGKGAVATGASLCCELQEDDDRPI